MSRRKIVHGRMTAGEFIPSASQCHNSLMTQRNDVMLIARRYCCASPEYCISFFVDGIITTESIILPQENFH